MHRARLLLVAQASIAVAACNEPPRSTALHIDRSEPDYGPLRGGTRIELVGSGFAVDGAGFARALVDGREAPLVETIADDRVAIVIPPGQQPGDAEVVVFHAEGSTSARGVFHYSSPPAIDDVSPRKILYDEPLTLVTVSGSGFRDEGAGEVTVLIDGQPSSTVMVRSDTELTFYVPSGSPLVQPTIEIIDERGAALRSRAFRYVPSDRPGLLLFPTQGSFAVFYEPVERSSVVVPWTAGATTRFTAVVRDELGDYWAVDRAMRFGRLDMHAQRIVDGVQSRGLYPVLARAGLATYAIERFSLAFGTVDLATSEFTRVGTAAIPCCGSYGLASDGTTLYFMSRDPSWRPAITPIDPVTGIPGTAVPLVTDAWFHVEDMRFFDGALYATSRDGRLATIDPVTGTVTALPVSLGRFNAMEILE